LGNPSADANAGTAGASAAHPASRFPQPANKSELCAALAAAHRERRPVAGFDLTRFNRVLWHTPEDMTVKVEAGITLHELQQVVRQGRQWLPIDPPHPEHLTIAQLLAANASGPRRFGHGTIRDHLIGLQVALADGRLASSGGNVVKNVAGYDLMKLFIGARHSLGFAVEATFKLLPLPPAEAFLQTASIPIEEVERLTSAVLDSDLVPTVLDWHGEAASDGRDVTSGTAAAAARARLVLGFAGTTEDVRSQIELATRLGVSLPATLDYEAKFWAEHGSEAHSLSVLPSRLRAAFQELGAVPFVARAGQGLIHYVGPKPAPPELGEGVRALARRVKAVFDPNGILPELIA
jgi:glycolate oxidase FAD binding subunit